MKFEKGKAKPFTQQEKVVLSLKKVAPAYRNGCSTWTREIIIHSLSGTPTDKGEQVEGRGTCLMHMRRTNDGTVLEPKIVKFYVKCIDSRDEQMGLPDVKVIEYNFSDL
jgi:hypothetical protein